MSSQFSRFSGSSRLLPTDASEGLLHTTPSEYRLLLPPPPQFIPYRLQPNAWTSECPSGRLAQFYHASNITVVRLGGLLFRFLLLLQYRPCHHPDTSCLAPFDHTDLSLSILNVLLIRLLPSSHTDLSLSLLKVLLIQLLPLRQTFQSLAPKPERAITIPSEPPTYH